MCFFALSPSHIHSTIIDIVFFFVVAIVSSNRSRDVRVASLPRSLCKYKQTEIRNKIKNKSAVLKIKISNYRSLDTNYIEITGSWISRLHRNKDFKLNFENILKKKTNLVFAPELEITFWNEVWAWFGVLNPATGQISLTFFCAPFIQNLLSGVSPYFIL